MEILQKILKRTIIRSSNSTPGYLSKENKNINLKKKYMHLYVHCSIIYNSQAMDCIAQELLPKREKNLNKNTCIFESLY